MGNYKWWKSTNPTVSIFVQLPENFWITNFMLVEVKMRWRLTYSSIDLSTSNITVREFFTYLKQKNKSKLEFFQIKNNDFKIVYYSYLKKQKHCMNEVLYCKYNILQRLASLSRIWSSLHTNSSEIFRQNHFISYIKWRQTQTP